MTALAIAAMTAAAAGMPAGVLAADAPKVPCAPGAGGILNSGQERISDPWAVVSEGKTACYVASRQAGEDVLTGLRIRYYDTVGMQQGAELDPMVTIEKVPGGLPEGARVMSVREAVDHVAENDEKDPENAVVRLAFASTVKETKKVANKTKVIKTDKLEKGEKKVSRKGGAGARYEESEIVQVNSNVVKKARMKSAEVEKPRTKIILEGTAVPAETKGMAVVAYGKKFLGNKYVWGGESLEHGVDCSGFTMRLYAHYGISIPHSSSAQGGVGKEVSEKDIQPGDLIVYDGHVAMYAGEGRIIHAAGEKIGIIISDDIHYSRIKHIRRIFGTDADTSSDSIFPDSKVIKAAFGSDKGFGDSSGLAEDSGSTESND